MVDGVDQLYDVVQAILGSGAKARGQLLLVLVDGYGLKVMVSVRNDAMKMCMVICMGRLWVIDCVCWL